MGYYRAGFDEIVGVDIKPQPRYPFSFVLGDALEYVAAHGREFDVIHASPPCQAYSCSTRDRGRHPDLYKEVRHAVSQIGQPFSIENVIGAPYQHGVMLCGSMFGLRLRRHRNFETSDLIFQPQCDHSGPRPYTITGNAGKNGHDRPHSLRCSATDAPAVMGMPWATWKELTQAIPPAYTEFIGRHLLEVLRAQG